MMLCIERRINVLSIYLSICRSGLLYTILENLLYVGADVGGQALKLRLPGRGAVLVRVVVALHCGGVKLYTKKAAQPENKTALCHTNMKSLN